MAKDGYATGVLACASASDTQLYRTPPPSRDHRSVDSHGSIGRWADSLLHARGRIPSIIIMPAAVTARTTAGQEGQGRSSSDEHRGTQARADCRADLDGDTQDTDPALDASSDPSLSLPNSQTSSLNISSASQASHFHPSSIGTSQSSVDKLLRRHASPPSPPFSQETRLSQDGSRNGDLSVSQAISQEHEAPSRPTLTAPDQAPHSTANKHKVGSTLGQKRTSSGHVKSPSLSLSTSPVDIVSRGHSRHTSTASNSSQVGEVSCSSLCTMSVL